MEIDVCNEVWSRIRQSISEGSVKIIPTKKSSHRSKPFWNANLSAACNEVQKCRKQFSLKSNYSNGLALDTAEEHFKTSLALEASTWIQRILREFGYKGVKTSGRPTTGYLRRTQLILTPSTLPRNNLHARTQRLLTNSEKFFF